MAFLKFSCALGIRRIRLVGSGLGLLIGGIGLRLVGALRLAIARTCGHHTGRGAHLRTLVRVIVGDFSHHGTRGGTSRRAACTRAAGVAVAAVAPAATVAVGGGDMGSNPDCCFAQLKHSLSSLLWVAASWPFAGYAMMPADDASEGRRCLRKCRCCQYRADGARQCM